MRSYTSNATWIKNEISMQPFPRVVHPRDEFCSILSRGFMMARSDYKHSPCQYTKPPVLERHLEGMSMGALPSHKRHCAHQGRKATELWATGSEACDERQEYTGLWANIQWKWRNIGLHRWEWHSKKKKKGGETTRSSTQSQEWIMWWKMGLCSWNMKLKAETGMRIQTVRTSGLRLHLGKETWNGEKLLDAIAALWRLEICIDRVSNHIGYEQGGIHAGWGASELKEKHVRGWRDVLPVFS